MPACCAVGCTNRPDRKSPGVTFHRFPKESVLRAAWIVACRRKNWLPSSVSVLCSEHFSEDLIDRTSKAVVRLRENAIPNIFKDYSPDLQTISLKRCRSPKEPSDFTQKLVIIEDEESMPESVKTKVCLNSPEEESSVEYVLPETTPEKCESPEKQSASTAATNLIIREEIKSNCSSNKNDPETPITYEISKKWKSSENRLAYTAATDFINNEVIEINLESMSDTSSEDSVIETTNSPINESNGEDMSPVWIPVVESYPESYATEDSEKVYLKRKLEESNNLVTMYRKKIKILQQQNRRWKKRLEKAKRSLNVLKKTTKSLFI